MAVHTDYPCKLICETPVKGRTQPVKVYAPA